MQKKKKKKKKRHFTKLTKVEQTNTTDVLLSSVEKDPFERTEVDAHRESASLLGPTRGSS